MPGAGPDGPELLEALRHPRLLDGPLRDGVQGEELYDYLQAQRG